MARAAILREIAGVFDAYKIDVNIRHLELIADYMVCLWFRLVWLYDNLFFDLLDVRRCLQAIQQKGSFNQSIATS